MMRALSLAALTVLELTPPDMVECAAQAGYDCVGLRLIPATPEEVRHPMLGDTAMVRETERRLRDTGVCVLDVEIFRLEPHTVVEDFRPVLETAQRLGASEVLVAGNDADLPRLAARLAELCALCAEHGLTPSIEPMPWTDVRDYAQGLRLIERTGAQANAGILVDPIHFDRGGSRLDEITATPRARLRYAQLCDAPAARPTDRATLLHQARAERLMPGDGGLDLRGLLRVLPGDIPLALEIPMHTLARSVPAVERARRMLGKTRQLLDAVDLALAGRPA